jgi:predicted RNA-binding protein with RPS1 domain
MVNTAIKPRVLGAETRSVVARANRISVRDRRRTLQHNIAKPKDRQTSSGQPSWIRFALDTSTESSEASTDATAPEVPQVPAPEENENDATAPAPAAPKAEKGGQRPKRRQQNTEKVREAVSSLKEGDMLKGKVRKLESFGAFVDIGVGKDALIHISQLSAKFTKNVEDILDVGQEVEARLLSIDLDSLRIQLSLVSEEEAEEQKTREKGKPRQKKKFTPSFKVGEKIVGKIASVRPFGCFVELGDNKTGLIHVSEIIDEDSLDSLADMNLAQGMKIEVVVAEINEKKREYKLRPSPEALKKMIPEEEVYVEENSIPPAMPFFMKEFGLIRSMYPDRPEVSYIPRGIFYKTEKLPTNPDGRSYKVVGSNYSDAANWADVIPSLKKEGEEAPAEAETQAAAVVEEPVKEEAAAPEAEEEAPAVETEAAAEQVTEEEAGEGKKKNALRSDDQC